MVDYEDLDSLNRRLAEIDALLDGAVHDPSPEQYALLTERDSLRELGARFRSGRDSGRTTSELEAELAEQKKRLKREIVSRTGYATAKGGNNQGPSPGAWVKLVAQSWAGSDIGPMNTRIAEIESELKRRRG